MEAAAREVDPTFLASPSNDSLRSPSSAHATSVSRTPTSVSNATATSTSRSGTARSKGPRTARISGFAVRVVLDGAWGFASGVALTESEAVMIAETAVTVARVAARMTSRPVELAPEPVHRDVTWVSAYDVNPFDVPTAEKTGLFAGWTSELLAAEGVDHASGSLYQVQENKYYADLAGSSITQQRVRVEPFLEVHGADATTGAFDSMRTIAPPVARGWEYLAGGDFDFDAERARLPELLTGEARRPERRGRHLRPGDPPVEPVADHPRVDRARHRARPCARLRGELRRHLVRHLRPAEHPAVRLPDHARHRRPHHRARTRDRGLRRRRGRGAVLGHRPRRRPRGLPARSADGAHLRRRAQRRAVQRLRVRRLPRPHPDPADGQRLAATGCGRAGRRRTDQPGRARHLRRRRPVLVDRHATVQLPVHGPTVLRDRGRPAEGPAP